MLCQCHCPSATPTHLQDQGLPQDGGQVQRDDGLGPDGHAHEHPQEVVHVQVGVLGADHPLLAVAAHLIGGVGHRHEQVQGLALELVADHRQALAERPPVVVGGLAHERDLPGPLLAPQREAVHGMQLLEGLDADGGQANIGREEGRVWDPKVCVPTPNSKFLCFPL